MDLTFPTCSINGADSQTKLSSNMSSLSDKTNGSFAKLEDKTSSSDMQALGLDIENSFSNLILEAQISKIVKDIHKPEDKPSSSNPRQIENSLGKAVAYEYGEHLNGSSKGKQLSGKLVDSSTWHDFQPGKRPSHYLARMEDEEIIKLGEDVFNQIKTGVESCTAVGLLILAYNLKDYNGKRVFGEIPVELRDLADEVRYHEEESKNVRVSYSKKKKRKVITPTTGIAILVGADDEHKISILARGFCYLAASYLRLYTKRAEHYTKIKDCLAERFKKFYCDALPFAGFHPDLDTIRTIRMQFHCSERIKHTFYQLLYAGEANTEGAGLKDFLYRIYVVHSRLHPYKLFMECMKVMQVSNRMLMTWLDALVSVEVELDALAHVFKNLLKQTEKTGPCEMWKFATIFDNSFLSVLQTKNCRFFALILANLLHINGGPAYENIFQIAQLRSASDFDRKMAQVSAFRVITAWNSYMFGDIS